MARDNFSPCLDITLVWEGGYSNHPDDPGGPTNKGVTQVNYNSFRKSNNQTLQSVKHITDAEVQTLYRVDYWNAMGCEELEPGLDLCVFDGAVNSGVGRAKEWLEKAHTVEDFCAARLAFVKGLGRLWVVFGAGWDRRIAGIRQQASELAKDYISSKTERDAMIYHAGMISPDVESIQHSLLSLNYPVGAEDGVFGEKTHSSIVLFETANGLPNSGTWGPPEKAALANAKPYPKPITKKA